MLTIDGLIQRGRALKCSDVHISVGLPICYRIHGKLEKQNIVLSDDEIRDAIISMMDAKKLALYQSGEDVDFTYTTPDKCRQRVNVFRYTGKTAATIRLLNDYIPPLEELGLPPVLKQFADYQRGLILVTGPTGSGKSTTLASMINYVNTNRAEHIITVEDPIEYMYPEGKSIIHQREVGTDVANFAISLRAALREDPDVILIGEMRDYETIAAALTAAETGHLVMSTLHTTGAGQTIDRIIDACPVEAQQQIRTQLSGILRGIVTQCLIPNPTGNGRFPATEVLVGTDAVLNLIREDKCHQLGTLMQSGANVGMHSLNSDLTRLYRAGKISVEMAQKYTNDIRGLRDYLNIRI